jgi:tetratricopeptide (TPR) repeat protein
MEKGNRIQIDADEASTASISRSHLRVVLLALTLLLSALSVQAQTPEDRFQQAMLNMFDGKWAEALKKLEAVQAETKDPDLRTRSYFYAARALQRLNRSEESLRQYERYLDQPSTDHALRQEARFSIVQLSVNLYSAGKKRYIDRALAALDSPDQELRLLAAVQISYIQDTEIQRKAVPVLQRAVAESADSEVQNQASLALLRIDPKLLEKKSTRAEKGTSKVARNASLHVVVRGEDGDELKLALPLSLARLLLSSLPEDAQESLRKRGINPDNVLDELSKTKNFLEVTSEGTSVRIWIE